MTDTSYETDEELRARIKWGDELDEREAQFIQKWAEVEQRLAAEEELAGELYRRYGRRQPRPVTLPHLVRLLWRARAILAGIEDRIDPGWQAEERSEPGPEVAAIIDGLEPDYLLRKAQEHLGRSMAGAMCDQNLFERLCLEVLRQQEAEQQQKPQQR